jgi:hypothetical protein
MYAGQNYDINHFLMVFISVYIKFRNRQKVSNAYVIRIYKTDDKTDLLLLLKGQCHEIFDLWCFFIKQSHLGP